MTRPWSALASLAVVLLAGVGEAAARRLEAVVEERAPVVWGAARGRGAVVDAAGRAGEGELALSAPRRELRAWVEWKDGSVVALSGCRVLSIEQGEGIAVSALADLVDGAGAPIARARPVDVVIADGSARLVVRGTTLDGRPDPIPGVAGDLALLFDGVRLAQPSRSPRALLETTRDRGQHPVGGGLRVMAVDGRKDRLGELRLAIRRGDGSSLVVRGTAVDAARGGVVVGGATASYGRVALAVWGWCDVTDGAGRTVARRRPLTLWITPDGVTRVSVLGVLHARLAGTRLR